MLRTLAVTCAAVTDCSLHARKTAVENASDEVVMGAVRVLCEFSLVVSQQNHSDLFLKALHGGLQQFYEKKGIFRDQTMSNSAKAQGDDLLARESHQLSEQMIYKICAAIEALVYGAGKVSKMKCRQFQVRLNRARQVATTWSDAYHQNAIEWLERKIHPVTPAKRKLFDKSFQHHQ